MRGVATEILWAEDSPLDQQLLREALHGMEDPPKITFVADGVELLERLRSRAPSLVVVDLKMPRMGGIQALEALRNHPSTRGINVVVFSSTNRPEEIAACRKLGAHCVQKPLDFAGLTPAVHTIVSYARA
ncbi:MAG TPA: response regulator [Candidatus Thermoplasmatota archaeon]|nr:response regulator [Candidatus Thermoplasmatota archaeon]